jgi:hypothetical protein
MATLSLGANAALVILAHVGRREMKDTELLLHEGITERVDPKTGDRNATRRDRHPGNIRPCTEFEDLFAV